MGRAARGQARVSGGRFVFPLVVALVAIGPLSTDLYLPSLPSITRDLDAGTAQAQLTLSAYMTAFAVVQLVYGPLSDRFGRKPVALAGIAIYAGATLACALAPTIEALIWARAAQAAGACAGVVLGRAIVRDVYGPEGTARALAAVGSVMAFAPAIGPILGGLIENWFGWRWNFALLLGFATVLLASLTALGETNAHRSPRATDVAPMLANYRMLIGDRVYLGYALCVAFSYGGLFAFISDSSFVLIDVLGLSPAIYAWFFALCVAGYFTGTRITVAFNKRLGVDRMIVLGASINILGGAAMLASALAGFAAPGLAGAFALVVPMALYMVGMGIVMPNGQGGALAGYAKMAGAASALMGFGHFALAALVGIAFGQLHDGGVVALPALVFACALATYASFKLLVRRQFPGPCGL
jgi:DHA1 family bicyclomycin/chloramphenicol resistance-like MFS transporter